MNGMCLPIDGIVGVQSCILWKKVCKKIVLWWFVSVCTRTRRESRIFLNFSSTIYCMTFYVLLLWMECSVTDKTIICCLKKIDGREKVWWSGAASTPMHGIQIFFLFQVDWPPDNMLTRCHMQQQPGTSLYGLQCKTPSCSRCQSAERIKWPAKSIDCNPIKNLRDNIKQKATRWWRTIPLWQCLEKFQHILQRAWANLNQCRI